MNTSSPGPEPLSAEVLCRMEDYDSIGSYLSQHAAQAPLRQHILFGTQVQRYARALGLSIVRFPGKPPLFPLEALATVHRRLFSDWDREPGPACLDQVANLCALLIGDDESTPSSAWCRFEVIEVAVQQAALFRQILSPKDTQQARRAKLGMLLHKHADQPLPNGLRLEIQSGRTRLYRAVRQLKPGAPMAPIPHGTN